MRVEKISENKVKITLTFEELEIRDITLTDIERNSSLARELFIDILEETHLAEEFATSDSQLLIEATSDNEEFFVITVTKIDFIPELKKYINSDFEKMSSQLKLYGSESIGTSVFMFSSIEKLLELCATIKGSNIFLGRNSLYRFNGNYFVIFNDSSIRNKKFMQTFSVLSEYCDEYYSYDMFRTYVKEKSEIVIKAYALQKLIKEVIHNEK